MVHSILNLTVKASASKHGRISKSTDENLKFISLKKSDFFSVIQIKLRLIRARAQVTNLILYIV